MPSLDEIKMRYELLKLASEQGGPTDLILDRAARFWTFVYESEEQEIPESAENHGSTLSSAENRSNGE